MVEPRKPAGVVITALPNKPGRGDRAVTIDSAEDNVVRVVRQKRRKNKR